MRFTKYFVIRPSVQLCDKLSAVPSSASDILLESVLWQMESGGRTMFSVKDDVDAVKVLFLANLKTNVLDEQESVALFADLQLTVNYFDEWWTVESFDGCDHDAREIISMLPRHVADDLVKSAYPRLRSMAASSNQQQDSGQLDFGRCVE